MKQSVMSVSTLELVARGLAPTFRDVSAGSFSNVGTSGALVSKQQGGVLPVQGSSPIDYVSWEIGMQGGELRLLFKDADGLTVAHYAMTSPSALIPAAPASGYGQLPPPPIVDLLDATLAPWGLSRAVLAPIMGPDKIVMGGSTLTAAILGVTWPDSDIDFYAKTPADAGLLRYWLEEVAPEGTRFFAYTELFGADIYDDPLYTVLGNGGESGYAEYIDPATGLVVWEGPISLDPDTYAWTRGPLPVPPRESVAAGGDSFYSRFQESMSSWYAQLPSGQLLQCCCAQFVDMSMSPDLATWLGTHSDLTCTSATWDGSAVVSRFHSLLALQEAWITEPVSNKPKSRRIIRWLKYHNRGFAIRADADRLFQGTLFADIEGNYSNLDEKLGSLVTVKPLLVSASDVAVFPT